MFSIRQLFAAALALLGCAEPRPSSLAEVRDPKYSPGQVWAYRTRPGEERSTLTVLRVEPAKRFGTIVHVAVDGLAIRNPNAPGGVIERAAHLPFAKEALDRSVVRPLRESGPLPEYEEGYQQWRRAFDAGEGGIFTITVREAVALFEPRPGQ